MPLDNNEWDLVRLLVTEHITGTSDPYGAVQMHFPQEAPGWGIKSAPAEYAVTIVEAARNASLREPNPLPIRLLQVLLHLPAMDVSMQRPLLVGLLDRLVKAKDALDREDPFSALILPVSGEIFIDRTQTRKLLASLFKPDPAKPEPVAMRVVGEKKSGKSYTYSFILHLSALPGVTPVHLMLSRSSTAEDILRDLSVQIAGPRDKPESVGDPVKRLKYWARWIVCHAVRYNPPCSWWFVLDQCNELDPSSDAVELIAQLSVAIRELPATTRQRPRLVLLGYGDDLADLQLPPKQIYEDVVRIVSETDLRHFFERVFRDIDNERRPDRVSDGEGIAKLVEVAVRQVIEDAKMGAAGGKPYMPELRRAAEEAVRVYEHSS